MKNTASRCRGYFYPRSPCGERRLSYFYIIKITQFLSTLSLRRATLEDLWCTGRSRISIHALLAESDPTRWAPTCRISNFYPRSPCGERPSLLYSSSCIHRFLSTLSLRRATLEDLWCTGRSRISIHALLAESDKWQLPPEKAAPKFLSTLSLRRATITEREHRAGPRDFYPRSPCGERHHISRQISIPPAFLSTLSLRRATTSIHCVCCSSLISIHALLAESDCSNLHSFAAFS